jgi:DNA-binding Xre family transcriptional regulator
MFYDINTKQLVVNGVIKCNDLQDLNGVSMLTTNKLQIDGDKIDKIKVEQIDATTAKIGTAMIEQLVVGTNVTMGENAIISWSNVSGRPNTTLINEEGMYTGYISADKITAGTLTGFTIQTASSGNKRIVLSGAGLFTYAEDGRKNGTCLVSNVSDLVMYNLDTEFFRIENTDGLAGVVKLKGYSDDILGYNDSMGKTFALGTWSFSSCTVEGLVACFG